MCIEPCFILITEEKNPTTCHLLLYYAYVRPNMFRVRAFGPETHPSCLHLTSIQQQLEKQTANVVTNAIVGSSW